jgi:hypothetical protein
MLLPRRTVLLALAVAPLGLDLAVAQQPPIGLRLVRRVGWQDSMDKKRCVVGDLYRSEPGFPASALGAKVCNVLELAYRNKANELVPIPARRLRGLRGRGRAAGLAHRTQGRRRPERHPAETTQATSSSTSAAGRRTRSAASCRWPPTLPTRTAPAPARDRRWSTCARRSAAAPIERCC